MFRCRINNVDHYQAVPLPEFDPPLPLRKNGNVQNGKDKSKISVIRVFGATESGQKVLMHIHGVLQYTYIEYSGSLSPDDVGHAAQVLQTSIDHALAISYRQNAYDKQQKYVAHVSLVKGVPFYGYHVGYKLYFKIYLLNPLHMNRLADLLREGAIMRRVLQPYESHMQYIAQWMCDYNLYGCAYLECSNVKFRGPVPDYYELSDTAHLWHDQSIPRDMISDEGSLSKQSHCALEVDVRAEDIVNRQTVEVRDIHHDFVERLKPLPIDKKLVQSMAGLWKDETRRRKMRLGLRDPGSTPFPPEVLVSMSADPRNTSDGGWIHEEEYRDKISQIAQQEVEGSSNPKQNFESFVKTAPKENTVQTALESVKDFYTDNIKCLLAEQASGDGDTNIAPTQAVIDETRIEGTSASGQRRTQSNGLASGKVSNDAEGDNQSVEHGSDSNDSDIKTPLSSGEFAALGVRAHGDFAAIEQDDFVIPKDLLFGDRAKRLGKRTRFDHAIAEPEKKPKLEFLREIETKTPTAEPEQLVEDLLDGVNEQYLEHSDPNFEIQDQVHVHQHIEPEEESLSTASPPHRASQASQNSRIRFSVVKDPNDPNTIKRMSQQSSSPEKRILSPAATISGKINHEPSSTTEHSSISATTKSLVRTPIEKALSFQGLATAVTAGNIHYFAFNPPSSKQVTETMWAAGRPDVIYQDAFYSNEDDVPDKSREYAGKEFKLESDTVPYLPDFDATGQSTATLGEHVPTLLDTEAEDLTESKAQAKCTLQTWSIAARPPSKHSVMRYFASHAGPSNGTSSEAQPKKKELSQIDVVTQANKHGFKYSSRQESTSVQHETQYMSVMALELHVNTRGSLAPNPEIDPIACVFWCLQTDDDEMEVNTESEGLHAGVLALADDRSLAKQISRTLPVEVEEEEDELELLVRLVDIVRHYDPDVLTGYEVHNSSWGYLIERARQKYDMNLCDEISRLKSQSHGRFGRDEDRWGFNHTSTIRVTGRHTINIWRAMRGELNLLQYTLENVTYHVLHKRVPHYSFADLTKWYRSKNPNDVAKVVKYFAARVRIDLEILEANELVPRTSEQARLIGVDWFSVISRGSQFKVENIMFRIAKPENLMLVSPSRRQVGGQNALECLPLVMEPQSNFYTSPMLVFDFQSLYPSVMIAYNYCYSTFLGRVVNWRGANKMGFMHYQRQQGLVDLLKDHINIAPNGIMYVKSQIRKSLLAKMLSEILETRVMVKSGMKADKDDKTLQRLLNNRQLALKLIANVTYGYTSASFSGRMPCSEIADSIVQTGRETLEKAIALIHSVSRWNAEVVYGDTDSLFVYLKGRSREQAFKIGNEIAKTITDINPRPVKLKFEKVYQPCVLLAKKRYVGFKYESPGQVKPEFEAKGIETVRRDGTPAEQKIEENALKILFRTSDLSRVKGFVQAQCAKIMQGRVSIQDFCFAREVKLGTYSDKGPPPPGALISARKMLEDPRLEPQYGERIPYVVVTGGPGARLIDRCVAPDVLLNDAQQELDAEYYISKNIIPPLERIFNLVGANVRQWYDDMPKYQRIRHLEAGKEDAAAAAAAAAAVVVASKSTILESYLKISHCVVCNDTIESDIPLCDSCSAQPAQSLLVLRAKLTKAQMRKQQLHAICRTCMGCASDEEVRCDSRDCPVFYSRTRQNASLGNAEVRLVPVVRLLERQALEGIEW